jgi:hypothetical protein
VIHCFLQELETFGFVDSSDIVVVRSNTLQWLTLRRGAFYAVVESPRSL